MCKSGTTTGADTPTSAISEQEGSADELAELHSNSAAGRAFRDRLQADTQRASAGLQLTILGATTAVQQGRRVKCSVIDWLQQRSCDDGKRVHSVILNPEMWEAYVALLVQS